MYSGTTFHTKSGRIMAVHQRIDRAARRSLHHYIGKPNTFPDIKSILHFEGKHGPDGIKSKSPGRDEPWHYIDPKNIDDAPLLLMISDHMFNFNKAIHDTNMSRAAFEAAWVAHAVTDGLTSPHHYPLEEKLTEMRGDKALESRSSIGKKLILPGKVAATNSKITGNSGVRRV